MVNEVEISGNKYKVVYESNDSRVIIDYESLFVLADRASDGVWELSGIPAHGKEKDELKKLTAPLNDKSVVTIIKDE